MDYIVLVGDLPAMEHFKIIQKLSYTKTGESAREFIDLEVHQEKQSVTIHQQ